jgi:hypothetical protein
MIHRIDDGKDDTPLGIPYFRPGPDSHDYLDLKREPQRADEIPELRKNPVLLDVVTTINVSTNLETFGCESWMQHPWTGSPWPEVKFRMGSYVDLAFFDARKFDRSAYEQMITDFTTTKTATAAVHVAFQHKQILKHPQAHLGLIWWSYGAGRTEEEAKAQWAVGIRLFKEFVLERYA